MISALIQSLETLRINNAERGEQTDAKIAAFTTEIDNLEQAMVLQLADARAQAKAECDQEMAQAKAKLEKRLADLETLQHQMKVNMGNMRAGLARMKAGLNADIEATDKDYVALLGGEPQ